MKELINALKATDKQLKEASELIAKLSTKHGRKITKYNNRMSKNYLILRDAYTNILDDY